MVVNYSANGTLRVDLQCGVSYGEDLPTVRRVAVDAITDVPGRDTSREVELFFEEFGSSSISFVTRFWVDYDTHADFLTARSGAICRLKQAFDAHDIMIPFPIRTLDFGIRGGQGLTDALPLG